MNKQQAQQIIRDTFENSFNRNGFAGFIKNLLNRFDDAPFTYQGNYIPDAYKKYIKTLERIGKFSDGENSIDILVITLQKETSLERARTMQRNFIAWYLNGSRGGVMKDAALAAFVSPDEEDWRFSLVKMDYKFEKTKTGKMKVKEEFTPARRWSFLVGANEKSHTAQSRLVNILANDEQAPTLEVIEKVFDIETVTKEFFLKYRELFLRTKEELDRVIKKDPKIKADFDDKGVDAVNFAKKLLGQIVFLYFLQKKGWFGVGRDDDWDTGSKHFLRELFEKKHSDYNNFYNDILEPLFYEALRIDRSHDDGYYSRFDCKIPFLNGGLFDPIGNYDWVHTDIIIPDRLFSNTIKTKEGDTGDGILDIFDRYNFTVKEDEPLEKEVAIDPELLGKAYEKFNAIRPDNYVEFRKALKSGKTGDENKFNKKFGVYYTPREIVHYMCQQSLINYLATELDGKVNRKDIETLIHIGEHVGENEARVISEGKETKTYSHKLPENIRSNPALVDDKLADITVCDPAVGSGAFPVGMMSEIVRARNVLSVFLNDNSRTAYEFKRSCIEHSLYGVDIDPGAVEIAKLRLWLSLVVDEDNIKNIKPLPNLDYKVVCGNSLFGVEKDLFNAHLFSELEKLKPLFFNETNPTRKQKYKKQIDKLISEITGGHAEFDFEVYFSEVFHEKGGFDIVIANPPYVRQEEIIEYKNGLKDDFEIYNSVSDLYTYFYEKGIKLTHKAGVLTFISSNKFMRAKYGKSLRNYLRDRTAIDQIVNFGEKHMFEAITNTLVLISKNQEPNSNRFAYRETLEGGDFLRFSQSDLEEESWTIVPPEIIRIKEKINRIGTPLKYWDIKINRGVLTGFNEAFVIDDKTKEKLCKPDTKNLKIIRPIIRGRDIGKYFHLWKGLWIIFIRQGTINLKDYSSLEEHLSKYKRNLAPKPKNHNGEWPGRKSGPYDWYEIQDNTAYYTDFEKEKVIWIELTDRNKFSYSTKEEYILAGAFLMTGESLKYLLSFLNSKLCLFYFSLICNSSGMATIQWKKFAMERIPIKKISFDEEKPFIDLVDKILALTRDEDYLDNSAKQRQVKDIEWEIDKMIYKLYDLTPEEIKIVEGEN